MLIVLSALSVVVAALLLAAWFLVGGGFALIYAAMGLAAASMVLLWVARWIGSTPTVADTDGPVALGPVAANPSVDTEPAPDRVAVSAGRAVSEPDPAPGDPGGSFGPAAVAEVGCGDRFPIADYDTRWLSEILARLDDLDAAELAMVDARERGGRHRAAVLEAIALRRPDAGGVDAPATRPEPGAWEQGPAAGPVAPLADLDLDPVGGVDDAADPAPGDADPGAEVCGPDDPFGELDAAAQAEEDRLWAAAVPLLDQGRDPFLDDDVAGAPEAVPVGGAVHHGRDAAEPGTSDEMGVGRAALGSGPAPTVDLTDAADLAPGEQGPHPDRGPRVRTFLGRRRSPVTVRHA